MRSTDLNSYNDIGVEKFTDDFLLLVLKNLKFHEREIKEEIETVRAEIHRRRLDIG